MSDYIDRQAAIDVWKEDFKEFVNSLDIPRDDYKGIMEYIDEVPSVQPERKPYHEEWISALRTAEPDPEWRKRHYEAAYAQGFVDGCKSYERQQEQNSGEWIDYSWAEEVDGILINNFECTCCHSWVREKSNFCPNCGADMRGDDE